MTHPPELLARASRISYAEETHGLAVELWDYVFPPWRWPEWRRRHRVVKRRLRLLQESRAEFLRVTLSSTDSD